jgi:hypothetical protein
MTVLHVAIFRKPFLPIRYTATRLQSITLYHSTPYGLQETENGYEEGSFRGAHFRRGIAATLQLTQSAESI